MNHPALLGLLAHRARSLAAEPDRVHCCDALTLLRMLPDDYVDMAITSPPYDDLRTYNGYSFDFEPIAREAYRVLKPGGVLVWVVGDSVVNGSETGTSFRQALYFMECGFRLHDTMIYAKDGSPFPDVSRYTQVFEYMFVFSKDAPKTHVLQRTKTIHKPGKPTTRNKDGQLELKKYAQGLETKPFDNIWRFSTGYNKTTKDKYAFQHPAMFPEKLAERHILTWSNPGDLVLDFFMGSGTTAKMARVTGRKFIGCDISDEYVELARKRVPVAYTPDMFAALDRGA